jgi:hypothetical protein
VGQPTRKLPSRKSLTLEQRIMVVNRIAYYLIAVGVALILFGGGVQLFKTIGWW